MTLVLLGGSTTCGYLVLEGKQVNLYRRVYAIGIDIMSYSPLAAFLQLSMKAGCGYIQSCEFFIGSKASYKNLFEHQLARYC